MIRLGLILYAASLLGFGFAEKIENHGLLLFCFLALRFLQGMALAAIQTTLYGMSGALYPAHQERVVAMLMASQGVGMTGSPIVGSFLYDKGGFFLPFGVFALIFTKPATAPLPAEIICLLDSINPQSMLKQSHNFATCGAHISETKLVYKLNLSFATLT